MSNKLKKTTRRQFEILVQFLQGHPALETSSTANSEAKLQNQQLWLELASDLNQYGPPVRHCTEWRSIWSDYKYNLKRKLTADMKLTKLKRFSKRPKFNKTELTVINLLELKDKVINSRKGKRKSSSPCTQLEEASVSNFSQANSSSQASLVVCKPEIDLENNQEGIIGSDDLNLTPSSASTTYALQSTESNETEHITTDVENNEPSNFDVNLSTMLKDTLLAMQKTQVAILNELEVSNEQRRLKLNVQEQMLLLEREKFEQNKLQKFEENRQAYIKIELKRKELDLFALELRRFCTSCTVKDETG